MPWLIPRNGQWSSRWQKLNHSFGPPPPHGKYFELLITHAFVFGSVGWCGMRTIQQIACTENRQQLLHRYTLHSRPMCYPRVLFFFLLEKCYPRVITYSGAEFIMYFQIPSYERIEEKTRAVQIIRSMGGDSKITSRSNNHENELCTLDGSTHFNFWIKGSMVRANLGQGGGAW